MGRSKLIRTKSVYSPIKREKDGLRILATRIRGRGLHKDRYDVWMANLGPSEVLLNERRSNKITWAEFKTRYRAELFESKGLDRRNRVIKNHGQKFTLRLLQGLARRGGITIMCHCPESELQCHRHVLREILERKVG